MNKILKRRSVIFALISISFQLWADEPQVIPLWEKGAPGFEERRNEPEVARD